MAIYLPDGQVVLRKNYQKDANLVASVARPEVPDEERIVSAAIVHDQAAFNAWLLAQTYTYIDPETQLEDPAKSQPNATVTTPPWAVEDATGALVVRHTIRVADANNYIVTLLARPRVPAKPVVTNPTIHSGWNASARSMDSIEGDGYFEFNVNQDMRSAYVGLVLKDVSSPDSISPKDAVYTFYLAKAGSYIRKKTANVVAIPIQVDAGARYRIVRENGALYFLVLDDEGTVLFRYDAPEALFGEVVLDVSVYRSNDSISFPILVTPEFEEAWKERFGPVASSFDITMPTMRTLWNQYDGVGANVFEARFDVTLPALQTEFTELELARFDITLPALRTTFFNEPFFHISGHFPFTHFSVTGDLRTMDPGPNFEYDLSWSDTFEGYQELQPLELVDPLRLRTAAGPPPGTIEVDLVVDLGEVIVDFVPSPQDIPVALSVNMGAVDVSNVAAVAVRGLFLTVKFGQVNVRNMSTYARKTVTSFSVDLGSVIVSDEISPAGQVSIQYVVNLNTGAVVTYDKFDFHNPQTIDGTMYGYVKAPEAGAPLYLAKSDITALDNFAEWVHTTIDTRIDFGGIDFGTQTIKNVDSVYAGMVSDGNASFELRSDLENFQTAFAYQSDNVLPTCRVVAGRGRFAKTWRLTILSSGATTFELDTLEYSVAAAGRRRTP